MTTVNDIALDQITGHSVDLLRVDAGLREKILDVLNVLEENLVKKLEKAKLHEVEKTATQRKRLEKLLSQTKKTISTAYNDIDKIEDKELIDLARVAEKQAVRTINTAIKASTLSVGMSKEMLESIGKDTLITGAPSKEWWQRQSQTFESTFKDSVRQGLLSGKPTAEIVRELRGTKTARYKDGKLEPRRRGAEALVRTSVQVVANEARLQTYENNNDIVKGIEWVSTLDSRTSPICRVLDGLMWDNERKPINHSKSFPGATAHWNCRSTQVPILKSWEELGAKKKFKEIPEGTRASMDGQVSAKEGYEDWLKGKDEEFQKDVLGKGKWELWKAGKVGFTDLVDQTGNPVSLEVLREKLGIEKVGKDVADILPSGLDKAIADSKKKLGAKKWVGEYGEYVEKAEGSFTKSKEDEFYKENFGGREEASAVLRNATEDADVFIAVRSPDLKKILADGKFKNSLESGQGSFATIAEDRVDLERNVFGITADVADHDAFPKYGFLSESSMTDEQMVGAGYGDVFVKLKKDVRKRTTFTVGDSFNGNISQNDRITPATSLANPKPDPLLRMVDERNEWGTQRYIEDVEVAQSINDIASLKIAGNANYIEAQVFGKVSTDDISEIFVSSKKTAESVKKALKRYGLDDVKVRGLNQDERLKSLWTGELTNLRMSLKPSDVDNLGQGYIKPLGESLISGLSAFKKNSKGRRGSIEWSPPEWVKSYIAKHDSGEGLSPAELRSFTREFYINVAKKDEGGLPEAYWGDYRKSLGGFTDDVMNESLLEAYYR